MQDELVNPDPSPGDISAKAIEMNGNNAIVPVKLGQDNKLNIPKNKVRRVRRSSGSFGFIGDDMLDDDDDDDDEEEFEDPEEMCYTNLLVSHPFLVHLGMFIFSIICIWLSSQSTEMTPIGIESLLPDDNKWADDMRALYTLRNIRVDFLTEPQSLKEQYVYQQIFFVLTEKARASDRAAGETPFVMTPSRLETIHKYEDLILLNPAWQDLRYYEAGVGGSVDYPCDVRARFMESETSIAQILKSMVPSEEDGGYEAMSVDTIKTTIKTFLGISAAASAVFDPSVLDGVDGNNSAMGAIAYRSIFMGGLPYPTSTTSTTTTTTTLSSGSSNGSNSSNSTSETETETCSMTKSTTYSSGVDKMVEQHFKSVVEPFRFIYDDIDIKHNGEFVENGLRIRTYSAAVWLHMNTEYMFSTIVFAFQICVLVILVYTTYDIGSLFLSMAALWEVIVTVPLAWFTYRIVCQIPQLGGLNFAIIFILFSVGVYYYPAYVFVDHWLQSAHVVSDPSDFKKRMAVAWKESMTAAGVAQSTTFVTFLSAGIGSVMWFRSFGIWAGIAIAVNYLLGITLFPCSIVIWELYIRDAETAMRNWLIRLGLGRVAFNVAENYHARYLKQRESSSLVERTESMAQTMDVGYGPQTYRQLKKDYRPLGFYLGVNWPGLVWRARWGIIPFLVVWFIGASYLTLQLERLQESEAFHGKDSFFYKSQHQNKIYTSSDTDLNKVWLTFGMKGLRPGSRNPWESFDYGEPDYIDMDISSVSAQSYLQHVCEYTRDEGLLVLPDSDHLVICWVDAFAEWLADTRNESFPIANIERNDFNKLVYEYLFESEKGLEAINEGFLQIQHIGEEYKLSLFRFKVFSIYLFWSTQPVADSDRNNWNTHVDHLNEYCVANVVDGATNGLCKMLHVSMRWALSESYLEFVNGAQSSVLLSLPLIFVILLVVLQNWIMSLLCCLNVLFVLLSCLSIAQLRGWKFGVVESCVIIAVLGFAVDYCVHIGHGYLTSPIAVDRMGRVRYTLLTVGHAILSSAFISFVATIPLLVGNYEMFGKMGIMILCTIGFSVVLSLTFFTLLLLGLAPVDNKTGRIRIQALIWNYCMCGKCRAKPSQRGEINHNEKQQAV